MVEELVLLSDDEEVAPRVATRLRSRTRSRGLRAQRKSQPEIIDIDDDSGTSLHNLWLLKTFRYNLMFVLLINSDQGVAVLPGLENGSRVNPLNDSFTDLGILLSVSVWLKGQTHNIFIYNVSSFRTTVARYTRSNYNFLFLFTEQDCRKITGRSCN